MIFQLSFDQQICTHISSLLWRKMLDCCCCFGILWQPTWNMLSIVCQSGRTYEADHPFRTENQCNAMINLRLHFLFASGELFTHAGVLSRHVFFLGANKTNVFSMFWWCKQAWKKSRPVINLIRCLHKKIGEATTGMCMDLILWMNKQFVQFVFWSMKVLFLIWKFALSFLNARSKVEKNYVLCLLQKMCIRETIGSSKDCALLLVIKNRRPAGWLKEKLLL